MKTIIKKGEFHMKMLIRFLLIAILLLGMSLPAQAEEEKPSVAAAPPPAAVEGDKPSFDFTTYALSKYVWRGYEMTRNSIVVQPSMTIGYKGFSANLWGNLDTKPYSTADVNYSSTWTETDLTLSYAKTIGILNAGLGYIYYGFGAANPGGIKPPDAQEVFATLGLNTLLNPTFTAYKEVDHYKQWYFLLGVSHTLEFNKTVSLKLAASASYLKSDYADAALYNAGGGYGGYPKFNDQYQATNDKFDNFHDGLISVSLPIAVAKNITVTPIISYSFPLSADAKNEIKARGRQANPTDNDSSNLYGGLGLTLAF
jgi:hypothetical protein